MDIRFVDVASGFVACLSLKGYLRFPGGRVLEEAMVGAIDNFVYLAEQAHHDCRFYLALDPLHGGSGGVAQTLALPSVSMLARPKRTNGTAELHVLIDERFGAQLLAHLPGEREWYEYFTDAVIAIIRDAHPELHFAPHRTMRYDA